MKRNRLIYCASLLLLGIYVYYYPHKIVATSFFALFTIPICSLLYMFLTYIIFKVQQSVDSRHVLKGRDITLKTTIYNDSLMHFPRMCIHLVGETILFTTPVKKESFILTPLSSYEKEYTLRCKYRGSYTIGIDSVIIMDPFKLFHLKFSKLETLKITVYPQITAIQEESKYENDNYRQVKFNRILDHDPNSVYDVRPYIQGDARRDIHWKLSAKQQEWMIKERREKLRKEVTLILDVSCHDLALYKRISVEDKCIEVVVSYIKHYLDQWVPLRLIYYGGELYDERAADTKGFNKMYRDMAEVKFTPLGKGQVIEHKLIRELDNGLKLDLIHVFTTMPDNQHMYSLVNRLSQHGDTTLHTFNKGLQPFNQGMQGVKVQHYCVNDVIEEGIV